MSSTFSTTQISPTVYRIVEDDPFYENPFIYLIKGDDQLVLIDTGCGTEDLCLYLSIEFANKLEISNLLNQILVINTHNHYDHVGCNYSFSSPGKCSALCASSVDKAYTQDRFNSLSFFVGSKLKPFTITRWLNDGEVISLSATDQSNVLKVIHVHGHTPDSLCLLYPKDNRVFVGDVIYRWAPILAIGVGACPKIYERSVERLWRTLDQFEQETSTRLTLSCGHIDDNLESEYVKKLHILLNDINSGKKRPVSCSCLFKTFSTDDGSLLFQFRRFRFFDPILLRFFKFIAFLCCSRN